MADRVYPSAKPNPQPPAAGGGGGPPGSFPAPKSQMYQRPNYRPQPAKRRRGRSCRCSFCCCFFWAVLVVLLLALVAAVAGGVFYLLYRPHRPAFSVSTARLAALNLSSSASALTDSIDVTVTAKNPNKKLVFLYDDISVTAVTAANSVPLGDASVPGFTHDAGNTTVIKTTIAAAGLSVDPTAAASDLKKSGSFAISVDLDTKAGVRVGSLKTKKIGIQVHCDGIKVAPPPPPPPAKGKGKKGTALAPVAAEAAPVLAGAVCQVRIRVKIWKWTF